MKTGLQKRWAVPAYLLAVLALAWSVWSYGYGQAVGQLAARGQADLALAADRLVTGLLKYRTAAVLLADHPVLQQLHEARTRTWLPEDGPRARAESYLRTSADRTGAALALYTDREGQTLAVSGEGAVPANLADQPWFQRAARGALGADVGYDPDTGARRFFFATPSLGPDSQVLGVLVMVVDLEDLEGTWRGARPSVFFTRDDGSVIVTNRSEMLLWTLGGDTVLRADGSVAPLRIGQAGGVEVWQQDWSDYVPARAVHLVQPLPVVRLQAEALVDVAPARRIAALQAGLVAVLCLGFGAVMWLAGARRRTLARANASLEARVHARTKALQNANTALLREVGERQEAEAALRRAQADLVQAGKLSALGQMSAGISHELNQPLMAIRQFAENGEAFLDRDRPDRARENLSRITALSTRAARIIKNLRAFAQGESEPMTRVDLAAVLDQACELTEARLAADGVVLRRDHPTGVYVKGGEVRLGQVFVNLINNAADAMAGQPDKVITLRVTESTRVEVSVQDTGPGIADPEKLFEPFYSTKQVGEGMGLGLSISYGLVQSFGGNIRGRNTDGGAIFTVDLDRWDTAAPD
ncbi:sensor histidine kinase [Sagittula sp. SSi028]|uniref:sensor histidine kinase n=1 Tax=Sagittula sp. SSi028 TaxID=3400636 RepID=UPI003AF6BB9F